MPYFISKPTRRELQERLSESLSRQRLSPRQYRGEARTVEEADELQRRLERETGEPFERAFAISNDSPDARQAVMDTKLNAGINPETGEYIGPRKNRIVPWEWSK